MQSKQNASGTLAVALNVMLEQQQADVKERHMAFAYVHQNRWLARPANHSAGTCLQRCAVKQCSCPWLLLGSHSLFFEAHQQGAHVLCISWRCSCEWAQPIAGDIGTRPHEGRLKK